MKKRILDLIAFLAYYAGIDAFFYWLNRNAKRILTFHNVLPDRLFRDGVANGVSNKLSDFERVIDECSKKFKFSTNLFDSKTLTVTFDDGYRNQYTIAFASLKKRGIPAYLYVAGACIKGTPLTVDLLTHWIDNVPAGRYMLDLEGSCGGWVQISDTNRASIWSSLIWPAFVADVAHKGQVVLQICDRAYPIRDILGLLTEEYRKERLDGISCDELREMRQAGWMIGWHTQSHFPLAKLCENEIKNELESSHEFKSVCFSYPYGNLSEVGNLGIQAVQDLGYPCAVSNANEAVENHSRFFLPRMSLPSDKYRLHFELSGFKFFLSKHKLLPYVFK